MQLIESKDYNFTITKLREFFLKRGFLEAPVQNRLSILAACEDPYTISTFNCAGNCWPLPQTGQMWLEYELLKNPSYEGFFCISTSYRNEPNPIPGRHDLIFPMFEFECRGGMKVLIQLEKDLLKHLGFEGPYHEGAYVDIADKYGVDELEHEHENAIDVDYGHVFFLKKFPNTTSPFWNMKQSNNETGIANKVDVIIHGVETIGSAERSCNPKEMREQFYNISNGEYAKILFGQFTKERVEKELDTFLELPFFKRCGGGIGVTRMIRAMKLHGLI